jgi:hypothetical protein
MLPDDVHRDRYMVVRQVKGYLFLNGGILTIRMGRTVN